jgi:beta-N-acetylhexosaminidase
MSDEEILSQVIMPGFSGVEPPESLLSWVRSWGLGGIKIFGWNARDTDALARAVADLQDAALSGPKSLPLLVATDQEGGWIRHVKGATSESPGNMAIGATGLERDAYKAGYYIGRELSSLGIHMNFAPDIDLATMPESSIIGPRAFSDDPGLVSRLGRAWARGSLKAGVIPTAKHFPGHGATPKDSHGTLPMIDIDARTFESRELVPFAALVKDGIPAIMSGHLAYPRIAGNVPASLSRDLIQGWLRKRLGHEGLVITDDLYMTGASMLGDGAGTGGGILAVCIGALMAGNDMLLLSVAPDRKGSLWNGLLSQYRSDEAFAARVREAAGRVVALKHASLRPRGREGLVPDISKLDLVLPDREGQAFFADLARRSASLLPGMESMPFRPAGPLLVAGPFDTFIARAGKYYPGAGHFEFPYRIEGQDLVDELARFREVLKGYKAVLVCVANPEGRAFAKAAAEASAEAAAAGSRLDVAVLSVLSPIHAAGLKGVGSGVAVYHYSPDCLEAGLEVLAGMRKAAGRIPLSGETLRRTAE